MGIVVSSTLVLTEVDKKKNQILLIPLFVHAYFIWKVFSQK